MVQYDAAAGMDDDTVDGIVSQIYDLVYPKLFRATIPVGVLNVASVTFDIDQAPTVDLQPSGSVKASIQGALDRNDYGETAVLSVDDKTRLAAAIAAATFGLEANSLALTVTYSDGTPAATAQASLSTVVSIQTSTVGKQDYLTLQIVSAKASTSDPVLEALLNSPFIPVLVPYLNTNFLDPIKIPALQYGSLKMSLPLPIVSAPYITVYSALGSVQPEVPTPFGWSRNLIYLVADKALLLAAVDAPFPLGPGDKFDWEIISGHVGAQVLAPKALEINSDGSISTSIEAKADMQLTLHTPWPFPNVKFGPKATVTMPATLKPSVANGTVNVTIEGLSIPTFDFTWGIPSWINWLFYPLEAGLAAALNELLGPLLRKALQITIPVYDIPGIAFTLAGTKVEIVIDDAKTGTAESMLLVLAQVSVAGTTA